MQVAKPGGKIWNHCTWRQIRIEIKWLNLQKNKINQCYGLNFRVCCAIFLLYFVFLFLCICLFVFLCIFVFVCAASRSRARVLILGGSFLSTVIPDPHSLINLPLPPCRSQSQRGTSTVDQSEASLLSLYKGARRRPQSVTRRHSSCQHRRQHGKVIVWDGLHPLLLLHK